MITDIKWWLDDEIKVVDTGDMLVALDGWDGSIYNKCFEVNDVLDNYAYGVGKSNLCVEPQGDGSFVLLEDEF